MRFTWEWFKTSPSQNLVMLTDFSSLWKSYVSCLCNTKEVSDAVNRAFWTGHNLCLHLYYPLQSNLQIQRSALLDDGTLCAHHLTPDCTCCKGFYQNYLYSICRWIGWFISTEYEFTKLTLSYHYFSSWEAVLILYKCIILELMIHMHV